MEENISKNILSKPCAVAIIGAKNSGKSYFLQYMLYESLRHKINKCGIVFCPTVKLNHSYNFLPQKYIYDDVEQFEKVFYNYVEMLYEKYKDKIPNNFIVLDDCIGLFNTQSNLFKNFISTFRHSKISIFIVSQYPNALLSPAIKENLDYIICFKSHIYATNESLSQMTGFKNANEYRVFAENYNDKMYSALLYNVNEFDDKMRFLKLVCPEYKTTQNFKY